MTEIVIRVPDELAAAVKAFKEWIPAMEIVSEKPCIKMVKRKFDVAKRNNTLDDTTCTSAVVNAYKFIEKCKQVARKIGELNGERLTIAPKGKPLNYDFYFDAENCCDMLDELYDEYSSYIDEYLDGVQSPAGISIVLPFIGKILGDYIFSTQQSLHKQSITTKLKEIYESDYIQGYLSFDGRKRKNELDDLFRQAVKIGCKEFKRD